ncbi:MAG: arsenate reductase ArsC [Candidatus Andersenbacteria bacterium]
MKKIIFVCAENAGRSQMAEAFFNTLAVGADVVAESAGTMPAHEVNPVAVEAMQEKGIDISSQSPKQFDPTSVNQYERLISFGCLVKEAFPPDIQERIEDWDITDPKGKNLAEVRSIRDDIERRVQTFLDELQP